MVFGIMNIWYLEDKSEYLCVCVCEGLSTLQPGGVCAQDAAVYRSAVSVCPRPPRHPAVHRRHRDTRGERTRHTAQRPVSHRRAHTHDYDSVSIIRLLVWRASSDMSSDSTLRVPEYSERGRHQHWGCVCAGIHAFTNLFTVCVVILASWKSTPCWLVFSWRWESIPQPHRLWRAFYHAPSCKTNPAPPPLVSAVTSGPSCNARKPLKYSRILLFPL